MECRSSIRMKNASLYPHKYDHMELKYLTDSSLIGFSFSTPLGLLESPSWRIPVNKKMRNQSKGCPTIHAAFTSKRPISTIAATTMHDIALSVICSWCVPHATFPLGKRFVCGMLNLRPITAMTKWKRSCKNGASDAAARSAHTTCKLRKR